MKYFLKIFLVAIVLFTKHSQQQHHQTVAERDAEKHLNTLLDDILTSEQNDDNVNGTFVPSTSEPLEFLPLPRIVGGTPASLTQFPYQVSLRQNNAHTCGGSIISQNYVLTAAHCVSRTVSRRLVVTDPRVLSVRAGSNLVNAGGVITNVAEVKISPGYRGYNNDIALLRLARPLTFTSNIRPITLNTLPIPAGSNVVTSGWGSISNNGRASRILLYVTLNALSNQQCSTRLGSVAPSILCLGKARAGLGACYGDSGGPAVYANRLVGVTNFVVVPCGTSAPDGFARVSSHIPWIRSNSDVNV